MNENYKNDENLSTRYTIWFMKRKIDIEYAYCLIVTKRKKKFSWAARNNVYNDGEISVGLNESFFVNRFSSDGTKTSYYFHVKNGIFLFMRNAKQNQRCKIMLFFWG